MLTEAACLRPICNTPPLGAVRPTIFDFLRRAMFPLAFLFVVALTPRIQAQAQMPDAAGAYDLYFNGIKKGFSRYSHDAQGRLMLEGDSGLGFGSNGTVAFREGEPQRVEFEVTGTNA